MLLYIHHLVKNKYMKCSLLISSYAVDYGLSVNKVMFCYTEALAGTRNSSMGTMKDRSDIIYVWNVSFLFLFLFL